MASVSEATVSVLVSVSTSSALVTTLDFGRVYILVYPRRYAPATPQPRPKLWNSLPVQLREADVSYEQFKRQLKTFVHTELYSPKIGSKKIVVRSQRTVTSVKLRLAKLFYLLTYVVAPPSTKMAKMFFSLPAVSNSNQCLSINQSINQSIFRVVYVTNSCQLPQGPRKQKRLI